MYEDSNKNLVLLLMDLVPNYWSKPAVNPHNKSCDGIQSGRDIQSQMGRHIRYKRGKIVHSLSTGPDVRVAEYPGDVGRHLENRKI